MQRERNNSRSGQLGKLALAAVLMAAIFVSLLLSASPALHEQFHPEATQSSHQCAITIFQQQHILISNPAVVIVELNPGLFQTAEPFDSTVVSDYNYRFSASRAPPALLSPLV